MVEVVRNHPSWMIITSQSPGGFPKCSSPCSEVLVLPYRQPLESHGSKEPQSQWLFRTYLSGLMRYFVLHICYFPLTGTLFKNCLPSSLVSILLSPSLCGWLLISSEGQDLKSLLQKTFSDQSI